MNTHVDHLYRSQGKPLLMGHLASLSTPLAGTSDRIASNIIKKRCDVLTIYNF